MKSTGVLSAAAAVVALAGLCTAQPTVDGSLSGEYPATADWLQNQPTQFGDNTATAPCSSDVSDAANVTSGVEISIPLTVLPGPGPYLICAMYIGDDFSGVSNQISGGLPNQDEPPLGLARGLDLNTYAGNQYIQAKNVADFTPVMDGFVDAAAGAQDDVQTTATSFGDNDTDALATTSSGSEIDNITASYDSTQLYIHVAGNMDTGFGGRLAVFIDDGAGTGENQLTDVPNISFDRFQNMGESSVGAGDGMIFDAGFAPDHGFFIISGNTPDFYVDYAPIDGTGLGGEFAGQALTGSTLFTSTGTASAGTLMYIDNSNIGGVTALCPPATGNFDYAAGSEIDAVYSCYDSANNDLYITITGNLETNNNKLNLFLDVGDVVLVDANGNPAGTDAGQNMLRDDNLPIDFGALTRMGAGDVGDPPLFTDGLIFDTGFNADYWIDFKTFDQFLPQSFANCSVLRTNGPLLNFNGFPFDYGAYAGGLMGGSPAATSFDGPTYQAQTGFDAEPLTGYAPRNATRSDYILMPPVAPTPGLIAYSLDNSNTAGVTDTDVADAANVTTGIELKINMDELGWDGVSPVRLAGFLGNGDNGFLSNQVIGGLPDTPPAANLGEPRGLDFSLITGDQFITLPMVACGSACIPDLTTTGAGIGDPGYGVPDGQVTAADIQYYVNAYVAGNAAIADLTTTGAGIGDPGYGVPDGNVTAADIQYYVNLYVIGCP